MAGLHDTPLVTRRASSHARLVRLLPVLLFLLALGPRLVAIGRYVTPDELVWVYRSVQFRQALLDGRWAGTLVAGHPGVTTTWLGALSISLQLALSADARAAYDWLTHVAALTPDNVEAFRRLAVLLTGGRLAVAVVNSLGVVGVYLLMRRLWPAEQGSRGAGERGGKSAGEQGSGGAGGKEAPTEGSSSPLPPRPPAPLRFRSPALLAALLLALDPFLAGLSGLFHVDGLSATFVTLALLMLARGTGFLSRASAKHGIRIPCYSGVLTGLAILTKTPTLVLLPVGGLAFLWAAWHDRRDRQTLLRHLRSGLLWLAAAALTIVILYPALWTAPAAVLATVGGSANRHLDEALRETFFLGRAVFDPGPLFYPIALLWRLSPVVWLAVLPGVSLLWRSPFVVSRFRATAGKTALKRSTTNEESAPVVVSGFSATAGEKTALKRSTTNGGWFVVGLLLLWAVVFLVAITPAAKKFDRYILPVVPALLIVAGVVWASWAGAQGGRGAGAKEMSADGSSSSPPPRSPAPLRPIARFLLPTVLAIQALFWLAHAAYPLAAYNPLVGGGRTAALVLPAGWGEGIGAAGRRLAETQPDATARTAIAGIAPALAPFFPGRVLVDGLDDPATADFRIVTLGGRQLDPAGASAAVAGLELLHTIRFGGLEQAWVYRRAAPRPVVEPPLLAAPVVFGERLALVALAQEAGDETVRLAARWRRLAVAAGDRYTLRLAVTDAAGNVWSATETDLLNEVAFHPPDWAADETGVVRYALELPPAMPPGRYTVQFSLVDGRTAGQLPVRVGDEPVGVVYAAGEVDVPLPERIVSASRVQIPLMSGARWADGALWLLGQSELPDAALAGSDLPLDLFWHYPTGALPAGLQLAWSLRPRHGGRDVALTTVPLSRFDTGDWRVGETIQEKYRLPLPPPTPAGRYALLLQPLDAAGQPLGPAEALGELTIDNIDRLYDVPIDVARPLLDDCFGATICLRGALLPSLTAAPGQTVDLILYWQALVEPAAVYTAFLHVLNEAGETVLSADHWPGGLPSDIWDAGQVIEDRVPLALPAGLPPGEYRIRVGLYTADDGRRLPLDGAATDYLILPWTFRVVAP